VSFSRQLALFTDEYDRLLDARDNEAYRALGAITAAICFCRQERSKDALAVLTRAIERYEEADTLLQQFKFAKTGENRYAVQASN
jgi:hypothetical protein